MKITNPVTNPYAITAITVFVPSSSWSFGAVPTTTSCGAHLTTATTSYPSAVECSGSLPPGFSDTLTLGSVTGPASPATAAPPSGTFTSTIVDAGSTPASYVGPTFSVFSIHSTTVAVTPSTAQTFTAGGSAITVTATLSSGQPGVPVTWSFGNGAYPTATLTNGNANPGGTLSSSSGTTGTSGTVSTTFSPSDFSGDATTVVATLTATITGATAAVTTQAGAPSTVTITPTSGGSTSKTNYIQGSSNFGTPVETPALSGTYALVAIGGITGTVADAFGNAVSGSVFNEVCTITAFGGSFDVSSAPASSDSPTGGNCGAGTLTSDALYYQPGTYGSSGYVQAVITGNYGSATGPTFSAKGVSQNVVTSTEDTGATAAPSVTCSGVACVSPLSAGSASGTVTTVTVSYTLTNAQAGVPVTFIAINGTGGGSVVPETLTATSGSFVGGNGPSFHPAGNPARADHANITAMSAVTSGVAKATATFTIDPTLNSAVMFRVNVAAPTTSAPKALFLDNANSSNFLTGPGSPSKLTVIGCFVSSCTFSSTPITKTVAGQTDYLDVVLTDFWGNPTANSGGQVQIALAFSPTSAGSLSATSVYIKAGVTDTQASFGTITFVINSGVTGSIAITASGFYAGSGALTIVSANPTVTVNTPSGTVGHTVYSNLAGVGFSGSAAVSKGVYPAPTIASVSYSIDGGSTQTAAGTTSWSFVGTFSNGLHSVSVYSTDSVGLKSATNTTTILVDTTAPTITAPTTLAYGAGTPVCFSITESEGDLNAASVVATSNSSAKLTTTLTGTNNPGASVTYQACVAGLPATTGHWSLTLNAKSLAGNAATAVTATVQVTVAFAQSMVLTGSLSSSTVNGYTGVSGTFSNQWSASQNVIAFAVWKNSAGQTVYVSAGSATISAGGSQSFFLPEVGLAAGGYTVNVSVWTTTGQPVSVQTSISVTV